LASSFPAFTVATKKLLELLEQQHPLDMDINLSYSPTMVSTRGKSWITQAGEETVGHIRLSTYLCNDENWTDTLKHEYAHLMAGVDDGHGKKWKSACKLVGCVPSPFGDDMPYKAIRLQYRYSCDCRVHYRARPFRKSTIHYCVECNGLLRIHKEQKRGV